MAQNISVPDIGDFKNVEVIEILVKPGDQIKKNDPIVTIESDKSSVEVPSPETGKTKEVKVKVGDKVSEGSLLATIDNAKVISSEAETKEEIKTEKLPEKKDEQQTNGNLHTESTVKHVESPVKQVKKVFAAPASKDDIDINYLTYELAKIMSELGDRHSSVKNEEFDKEKHLNYSLQLPFSIATLQEKVVAIKKSSKEGIYEYVHTSYPYIKSINNIPINKLIDSLVYRSKKAPKEAKLNRGVSQIQQFGKLYVINNIELPEQIRVTYTNGKTRYCLCWW